MNNEWNSAYKFVYAKSAIENRTERLKLLGLSILIVADEPAQLRDLNQIITAHGGKPITAITDVEGIRLAIKMRPDMILMSENGQELGSYKVLDHIQKNEKLRGVPVLLIVGVEVEVRNEIRPPVDAIACIKKPFSSSDLVARILAHAKLCRNIDSEKKDEKPEWFIKCLQWIHELIHEDISLRDVENKYGLSEHILNVTFKKYMGITISKYLREVRLEEAARLLRNTIMPIADVALLLAYDNPANFATKFKRRYGVSPREYRNRPE